jgi:hypothetical protein
VPRPCFTLAVVTRGVRLFWLFIAILLGASAFFASGVGERRARGVEAKARASAESAAAGSAP